MSVNWTVWRGRVIDETKAALDKRELLTDSNAWSPPQQKRRNSLLVRLSVENQRFKWNYRPCYAGLRESVEAHSQSEKQEGLAELHFGSRENGPTSQQTTLLVFIFEILTMVSPIFAYSKNARKDSRKDTSMRRFFQVSVRLFLRHLLSWHGRVGYASLNKSEV